MFVNLIVIPALPVVFISGLLASAAGCFGVMPGKLLVFPAFAVLKLYEVLCGLVMKLPGHRLSQEHLMDIGFSFFMLL